MNKIFLIGNLTSDPVPGATTTGKSVSNFTIAVNRKHKAPDGSVPTDFFRIAAFGSIADTCNRYLSKGKKVGVIGELQTSSYEKDGIKYFSTAVVAHEVEFLTPKGTAQPAPAPQGSTQALGNADLAGFSDLAEEELPL